MKIWKITKKDDIAVAAAAAVGLDTWVVGVGDTDTAHPNFRWAVVEGTDRKMGAVATFLLLFLGQRLLLCVMIDWENIRCLDFGVVAGSIYRC